MPLHVILIIQVIIATLKHEDQFKNKGSLTAAAETSKVLRLTSRSVSYAA